MFRIKISVVELASQATLAAMLMGLLVAGCTTDQGKPAQRPSTGVGTAVQPAPWVDDACYREGSLVALECNEPGGYPTCPAEDSPRHAGQPCFWVDPDGKGLLWSDGVADAGE